MGHRVKRSTKKSMREMLMQCTKEELIKLIMTRCAFSIKPKDVVWNRYDTMCDKADSIMKNAIASMDLCKSGTDRDEWLRAHKRFKAGSALFDRAQGYLDKWRKQVSSV